MKQDGADGQKILEQLRYAVDALRKATAEYESANPESKLPLDEKTKAYYEQTMNEKQSTVRVVLEHSGPRSDELAAYISESLLGLVRVEPYINPMQGQTNPFLMLQTGPDTARLPGARAPFYVVLVNTIPVSGSSDAMHAAGKSQLLVSVCAFRPEPFVCLLQHVCFMPASSLKDLAGRVVAHVRDYPESGIAALISDRDAMFDFVLADIRHKYVIPN